MDANHLDATFDLTGTPIGNYVLQISDSGKTSSGTDLISVAAGTGFPYGGAVSIVMLSPAAVHVGASIPVTVTIKNSGWVDAIAPITQITATGVVPSQNTNQTLASSDPLLPGILQAGKEIKPGASYVPAPKADGAASTFDLSAINPTTTIVDWASQKAALRPSTIPADAWDAVWSNLQVVFGSGTLADYYIFLKNDATDLAASGVDTQDVRPALQFRSPKSQRSIVAGRYSRGRGCRHAGTGSAPDLPADLRTIGCRTVLSRPAGAGLGGQLRHLGLRQ